MSVFGSTGDGGAAKREKARQSAIQKGMSEIDSKFSTFTPEFYQGAADNYVAAQTPNMMQDYQTTKNNLTYSLARAGLMDSAVASQRTNSLQTELGKSQNEIAQNAMGVKNDLQARVNQQKGVLTNQLEASGDATAITSQADAAVSQMRAPSPIQPLGNLFADWSQQYLNNQAADPGASVWSKLTGVGIGQANPATYNVS